MRFQIFFFHLILLLLFSNEIGGDYKNTLRLCKIECVPLKSDLVANFSCNIKALSRFRTAINVDGHLSRSFDNILINMQIFKKNSVRYLPFMVNVTVDICRFLAGNSQSYYARFMLEWVRKYSNVGHPCPYVGHLYAKNLEPFADKIPVFVPTGDYRLDLNFYEKTMKNKIGYIRGYGTMAVKLFITEI